MTRMIRDEIRKDIMKVISSRLAVYGDEVQVTRTSDAKFGDFTTNVALRLASFVQGKLPTTPKSKQSPVEVAKKLADSLKSLPYIEKLEVAGPGFINFFVKDSIWQSEIEKVLKKNSKYGSNAIGRGKKARVEFVSANPTGPLHFGNARGGPIGDTLANVLSFSGYEVLREYLHNDVGGQVQKLGKSVVNVASGQKLADQEYKGEYVAELAKKIGKVKTAEEIGQEACEILLDEILADCGAMGIKFDEVFKESGFIESGKTKSVIDKLKAEGALKGKEGAVWFAPNDEFLKDRETVVVKSDGTFTYFANDIAYHDLKFKDNPDLVIDLFGANHHGHVPRLQAVISALGYDVSKFKVILYQWVRFKSGGKILGMSKRSGNFITVREVLDRVGSDASRFFILMHDASSHIDFDLDLAKEKTKDNPVYYVQYAHARIASILSKAKMGLGKGKEASRPNLNLLTTEYELDLIKQISRLPELVEDITASFAVHRLTTYAMELADALHKFYENCRVISEDEEVTKARLALCEAAKIALANTLKLLGVSAPQKM